VRIDAHVHLIGVAESNGGFLSSAYRRSLVSRFLRWRLGLGRFADDADADRFYLESLAGWVRSSTHVDRAVLLALDGRYDRRGRLDRETTSIVVGNDYLFAAVERYPDLFLAAPSVNPYRADALDELDRVKARGAVLIKWLPPSQAFDPADPRCAPFYRKLVDLGLPLLTHTGHEHTIPVVDQALGHPLRLVPALEAGVTVIAAHCGMSGIIHRAGEDHFPAFIEVARRHPNLHGDISALGSAIRVAYPPRLLALADLRERLIYGSDVPVPCNPIVFAPHVGARPALALAREPNPIERHAALCRALGFGADVFGRAAQVLKLQPVAA